MNIKQAKEEIRSAVRAYLERDDLGRLMIPRERQRPLLIMGPPGIGKTAIMRQIASELDISLVSYTITHHTRQSAIGLPYIERKEYGGREQAVTEYTMSEIIASVYDRINETGIREGILFLDEINCASETLFPTMLQFLQYKTFGSHSVPEGYVIVTAGNPPEYNRSARELDVVTLDRVRRMDVEADFPCWKEYAKEALVHGAVVTYLEIRKDHFYSVRTELDGRRFVTARGWEDLSDTLKVYEALGQEVSAGLVYSFLQDEDIAKDFYAYYELWKQYRSEFRVPEILAGRFPDSSSRLSSAPFDEKLSLIGLLSASLGERFRSANESADLQKEVFTRLKALRELLSERGNADSGQEVRRFLADESAAAGAALLRIKAAGRSGSDEEGLTMKLKAELDRYLHTAGSTAGGDRAEYGAVRERFAGEEAARRAAADETRNALENAFSFLAETFGEGQELVLFLSELTDSQHALRFIRENGSSAYYRYSRLLLLKERHEALREEIMELQNIQN